MYGKVQEGKFSCVDLEKRQECRFPDLVHHGYRSPSTIA